MLLHIIQRIYSVPFLRIPAIYGTYYNMFVGWSNLFIAVYSLTGYGVKAVCYSSSLIGSMILLGCACRVGRSSLTGLRHSVQSVLFHAPYSSIWLTPYSSCLTPIWTGCVLHGCFTSCLISVFLLLYIWRRRCRLGRFAPTIQVILTYILILLTSCDVMPLFFISFYAIIE